MKPQRTAAREWTIPEWALWLVGSYAIVIVALAFTTGTTGGPTPPRAIVTQAVLLPVAFLASSVWAMTRRTTRPPEEILHLESARVGRDIALGTGVCLAMQ